MRVIKSYGIACIDVLDKSICMVRRRNTYMFESFFYGMKFSKLDASVFDKMTIEEKIDILSLDYNIVARRVYKTWNSEQFLRNKIRYENNYLSDGGTKLIALINASSKSVNGIWEIPKGRPTHNESTLATAIREFTEETHIPHEYIMVDTSHTFSYSFVDCDVRYEYMYYLAFLNKAIKVDVTTLTPIVEMSCMPEIVEVMWMTYDMLNRIVSKKIACSAYVNKLAMDILVSSSKIYKNRNRIIKRIIANTITPEYMAELSAVPCVKN